MKTTSEVRVIGLSDSPFRVITLERYVAWSQNTTDGQLVDSFKS